MTGNNGTLLLDDRCFLHENFPLQRPSLLSPHVVPSQPTAVPSMGMLSIPHIPAPSPCANQWTPFSGWGMHDCGMDHLCRSHFVASTTDWLLHSLPSPRTSSSIPADHPNSEGISPDLLMKYRLFVVAQQRSHIQLFVAPNQELLISFSSPPCRPHLAFYPLPFSFFLLSYPIKTPKKDLSHPFRYLRFPASVQQMLCENCPICSCIVDVFVKRYELYFLLLLHHLKNF